MPSPDDIGVIERDPALPAFRLALDPDAIAEWAAGRWRDVNVRGAVLQYVRYKPGTSVTVGGRLLTDAATVPITVKAFTASEVAAPRKAASWAARRPGRRAPLIDGRQTALVTSFPYDAKVRRLDRLLAARGPVIEVLSHRPERRVVLRVEGAGGPSVLRAYAAPEFAARTGRFARFGYASIPGLGAVEVPFVAGAVLEPLLATIHADRVAAVGEALKSWQRQTTSGLPRSTGAKATLEVQALAVSLAVLLPEEEPRLRLVADRIVRGWPQTRVTGCCHGDFAARQVIIAGEAPTFVDFDEAVEADPRTDVASFLADLDLQVLCGRLTPSRASELEDAFLRGYDLTGDERQATDHVRAAALLALAPLPFRRRWTHWRDLTIGILGAVDRRLDSASVVRSKGEAAPANRSGGDTGRELPWLPRALDARAVEAALVALTGIESEWRVESAALVRHKPGRRAVIRYRVRTASGTAEVIGKMHHRGVSDRAVSNHLAFREAGFREDGPHAIAVPRVLGSVPELGLWLQAGVAGTSAGHLLAQPGAGATARRLAEIARAFDVNGPRLPRTHRTADELTILDQRLAALAVGRPWLRHRIGRVMRGCRALASRLPHTELVPAHRDFHPEQVLIDGPQAYVLDLDLACMAAVGLDAGNMLAHLIEARLRDGRVADATIAAFEEAASADLPVRLRSVLPVWTTLALTRLIEIADRLPERGHAVQPLLAAVEHRLDDPGTSAAATPGGNPCLEKSL